MPNVELAQTSNDLFVAALLAYVAAMVAYFFRLAFTRVSADGIVRTAAGERVGAVATALASGGATAHLASVVTRGLASGRPPWMNMYEYSSVIALTAVVVGLVVVQRREGYRNLMGFILAGAVLMMASALLLYVDAAPVQPALDSWWRLVHVTTIGLASSIFMVGFAMAALYLVKDTAERRLAARSGTGFTGSTVGAAHVPGAVGHPPVEGLVDGESAPVGPRVASLLEQRDTLSWRAFTFAPFALGAPFALLLGAPLLQALGWGAAMAGLGALTWLSVPYLPPAATLDNLAYRINAFAFPIYTFAVIAGAMWAEVAWGRYWGWDAKETSAFFTWVFYAGYLHARSTRGWRGRPAAWVNVGAYGALLVTYYVVNLVVSGLHSYAGVD